MVGRPDRLGFEALEAEVEVDGPGVVDDGRHCVEDPRVERITGRKASSWVREVPWTSHDFLELRRRELGQKPGITQGHMQPYKAIFAILCADDAQDALDIRTQQQGEQEMGPNLARRTCEELRNSVSVGFSL